MRADPGIRSGDYDYSKSSPDYATGHSVSASAADRRALMTLNYAAEPASPRLSVVVPTRNEEGNVGPLLERLAAVLPADQTEVIVVDDRAMPPRGRRRPARSTA
jgi:cellulose synthase/poly-beta-1,6-N-acetylglucosamine synthase-like glycosyltransferase